MGYSSNPATYSEEEQAIMITALGRDITLTFPTHKQAFNQRARFYGLRKAVLTSLKENKKLEKQGLGELCVNLEIVTMAVEIQKVGIGWSDDLKTSICLGRNVGNAATQAILRAALGSDFRTPTDLINDTVAAFAKSQLTAYQATPVKDKDNTGDAINDFLTKKEKDDEGYNN